MHLLLIVFGIFTVTFGMPSHFNPDYPNVKICVISEAHGRHKDPAFAYKYLKDVLGLSKRCTHIYGNLHITGLGRLENGTDPDLSFLESIVEISGTLVVHDNSVKRIPLTNLKVIRGLSQPSETEALRVYYNTLNQTVYLEELDLRNLRVIMKKKVFVAHNPGLQYLQSRIDWQQIIEDSKQTVEIHNVPVEANRTFDCHSNCTGWKSIYSNGTKFCFGPSEHQCQQRTKCESNKDMKWCNFTKHGEVPCNHECAGGCHGKSSGDCAVCINFFKGSKCSTTCTPAHNTIYGADIPDSSKDKLIYTVGGLCTSQCPARLMDQNKICVYQCDFNKYYKHGNRCIECPNDQCSSKIGDNLICDLNKLDPRHTQNGRKYTLNDRTLKKLENCTMIVGQVDIDDKSFKEEGVTVPMLYDNLKNVREIFGNLAFTLLEVPLNNLTFLPNLMEIRQSVQFGFARMALKIIVTDLKFLGLKRLKKVYGEVKILAQSDLCYVNKIPWKEITSDVAIRSTCNATCHSSCSRGCWGPGDKFCYRCEFLEAGESCVKQCHDTPGFYLHNRTLKNSVSNYSNSECRKCSPLCKQNCTGPLSKDCYQQCKFAMEDGNCVESCSTGFFPLEKKGLGHIFCSKCHNLCYVGDNLIKNGFKSACNGSSDILGLGGCSMCEKIIYTANNETRCHRGSCPIGYYTTTIEENGNYDHRIIQQSSCVACNRLCKSCTGPGTYRSVCTQCDGYFYNNQCVTSCPKEVKNVMVKLERGENCPRCHEECKNGCLEANDNSKCNQCVNKKLYRDIANNQFLCLRFCPSGQNNTEYQNSDLVCLRPEDTSDSKQRRKTFFIILGVVGFFVIVIVIIAVIFKSRSNHAKIKAELKALYSNYKESNMKNMKEDITSKPPNMRRLQMIPICDLIFDETDKPLGSGAFGKVYRGYWKVPGPNNRVYNLDVVIKVIHNSSKSSTDEFLEEAKIMASVTHRHCLPLIGVCLSLKKPCLVSTYAKFGSLDKYLHQYSGKISSYSMLKWAEQIADGMAYLNIRGIVHRDLAARNILLNSKNVIQITDFGLARLVDEKDESVVVKSGRVPIRWLALETLLSATYSSATDVWAYGVTLWEIFTYGKRPYENLETNEIKAYLQQGNRLCQPEISTLEVYMVMIKCWLDDPHMRPSFSELMAIFEQFSLAPKRFLCLPREHVNEETSKSEQPKDMVALTQMSIDYYAKPSLLTNNKSDEFSWGSPIRTDSAYHLISNSYSKDQNEDNSFLPRRKKTKRAISMDKFRSLSKFDLGKIISSKNQKDSKGLLYQSSSIYDGNKTTCTSFDSTTPLFGPRSSDYDSQPSNPQIAKLKKEIRQNSHSSDGSSKLDNSLKTPDRVFIDKNSKDSEYLLSKPTPQRVDCRDQSRSPSRSPSLPPINLTQVDARPLLPVEPLRNLAEKPNQNSPDSGVHNFDIDDYLVPSRISSAGYYNVTPSPSSNMNHTMDLNDPALIIHNKDYTDDGYLEPEKTHL